MTMMFDQNNSNGELTPEEALAAICGEGKKYASAAELAKAYLNADNHISVLEAEAADLRKKGDQTAEVQELLKQLREGKLPQQQAPAPDPSKATEQLDIDKLLEEKLNTRLNADTQKANQSQVIGHFKGAFGTRAGDMFDKLAKELDMTKEQLEAMSAERPGAVVKLADKFLGTQVNGSTASLSGDHGAQGSGQPSGMPATRSELIKKAEAEKWPRAKKYQMLNQEMTRAAKEKRLDSWNR